MEMLVALTVSFTVLNPKLHLIKMSNLQSGNATSPRKAH